MNPLKQGLKHLSYYFNKCIDEVVKVVNPLKQGLKLQICLMNPNYFLNVKVVNPLKQGLKPFLEQSSRTAARKLK